MSSLLAWSRVFSLFATFACLTTFAAAQEKSLFTSSVTYCEPPETLLIQRFELAYFPSNSSVSFNVSVSSVQANVNVTANLLLNVYGMNPVNVTLDLCGILGGTLCPLPMYNFTGADSITMPASLSVLSHIPGIAYAIPDLEGFAQLTLTEAHTGITRACVQATISNGRSTHQPVVEWTMGAIAIAALLAAALHSILSPESIVPFRFLELMYLFQTIASSAFLSLNYPSVYRAYAQNFAWAMGLIASAADSSLQKSINHMRHITGGTLADAIGGSAVGLVNRKLSPFNSRELFYSDLLTKFSRIADTNTLYSPSRATIVDGIVQTVTSQSSNVLQAGIPIYVNLLHIATANAFMTVFLISLCLLAIFLAALLIGHGAHLLIDWKRRNNESRLDYTSFAISWLLRLGLVLAFPLLIFIFYQWTLKDSCLSIFIAILSLIAISSILYPSFLLFRVARRESPSDLYHHKSKHLIQHGPLYAQYRPARYYFFVALLVGFVLRAVFISFVMRSGIAQISLMIVLEFGIVLANIVFKPAKTKGGDVFSTYLAILRLACAASMIAFIESLRVKAIPRVVIGFVLIVLWSIGVLVVIANLLWHTVLGFSSSAAPGTQPQSRSNRKEKPLTLNSSQGSMLEKDSSSTQSDLVGPRRTRDLELGSNLPLPDAYFIEEIERGRPINPTPEHNAAFDPFIYSISPATTVTSMDLPSLSSRDSETITVGVLLPRRWSFTLSRPGSPPSSTASNGRQRSSGTPSPVPPPSTPSEGSHSANGSNGVTSSRTSSLQYQSRHPDIEITPRTP